METLSCAVSQGKKQNALFCGREGVRFSNFTPQFAKVWETMGTVMASLSVLLGMWEYISFCRSDKETYVWVEESFVTIGGKSPCTHTYTNTHTHIYIYLHVHNKNTLVAERHRMGMEREIILEKNISQSGERERETERQRHNIIVTHKNYLREKWTMDGKKSDDKTEKQKCYKITYVSLEKKDMILFFAKKNIFL